MKISYELVLAIACGALTVPVLNFCVNHLGSKIAGALGGFPATIAASMYVIGSSEGIESARKAVAVLPAVMGIDGLFLLAFAWISYRGLWRALFSALLIWVGLAYVLIVYLPHLSIWISLAWMLASLIFSFLMMEKYLKIPSIDPPKIPLTKFQIAVRMLGGIGVVVAAYIFSSMQEPVVAGVASAFPAVLLAAITAIAKHISTAAAAAFVKAITIHSMVNASVYAGAVYYFFPLYGATLGTLVSVIATLIIQLLVYLLVERHVS